MKRADVVNLTGGVETDDGRTLFGMDAEHYMKVLYQDEREGLII